MLHGMAAQRWRAVSQKDLQLGRMLQSLIIHRKGLQTMDSKPIRRIQLKEEIIWSTMIIKYLPPKICALRLMMLCKGGPLLWMRRTCKYSTGSMDLAQVGQRQTKENRPCRRCRRLVQRAWYKDWAVTRAANSHWYYQLPPNTLLEQAWRVIQASYQICLIQISIIHNMPSHLHLNSKRKVK